MVQWSPSDFEDAITRLSKLLRMHEEFQSWSICNGCLESKTIRHNHPFTVSTCDECLPLTEDSVITDCDAVHVGSCSQTEWRLSIAYNFTWHVPVMYFMVQFPDGTPCARQDMLDLLLCFRRNRDSVSDMWDFVSSEEHPITGVPSFFLHPCRTSSLLETLNASTDCSTMRLWSWMAMIFPSIGLSISAETYCTLQTQLKDNEDCT
jgi:Autophagocytosis associated protein, active-site domain